MAARRPKFDAKRLVQKGDILKSTWGWEQTNVTFYEVLARSEKGMLLIQKIGTKHKEERALAMAGTATPDRRKKDGKPFMKKAKRIEGHGSIDGDYVRIESYEHARLWDGKPVGYTAYA